MVLFTTTVPYNSSFWCRSRHAKAKLLSAKGGVKVLAPDIFICTWYYYYDGMMYITTIYLMVVKVGWRTNRWAIDTGGGTNLWGIIVRILKRYKRKKGPPKKKSQVWNNTTHYRMASIIVIIFGSIYYAPPY